MALVEGQCVQQAGFSTCSTTSVTYHPASCVRTCWNVIPALLLCLSGTDGSDPTVKPSHPYHQPIAQKCSEWDASPPIKHKQKGDLRCELSGTIDKQWTPQANYANYGFKWLQLISIYHNLSLQYVSLLHLPVRTLGDFMTALVRSCYVGLKQLWSFSHDRKSLFWLVSFPRMVLWPSRTIGIQLWSIMYNPIFDALHMANHAHRLPLALVAGTGEWKENVQRITTKRNKRIIKFLTMAHVANGLVLSWEEFIASSNLDI